MLGMFLIWEVQSFATILHNLTNEIPLIVNKNKSTV